MAAHGARDDGRVLMVVDAAGLTTPQGDEPQAGVVVRVYRRDIAHDDPEGLLFETRGEPHSAFERARLPRYAFQQPFATMGPPLVPRVERQTGPRAD